MAQKSGPGRPLFLNVLIDPNKNVTQDRSDKRFSAYPKTTPLFQLGEGFFITQLQESSTRNKPEIPKSVILTEQQTCLPKTTFHLQRTIALQNKQRCQSPKNIYRNRLLESQNQTTVRQPTAQVTYELSVDPRGIQKLKLTEFAGELSE